MLVACSYIGIYVCVADYIAYIVDAGRNHCVNDGWVRAGISNVS